MADDNYGESPIDSADAAAQKVREEFERLMRESHPAFTVNPGVHMDMSDFGPGRYQSEWVKYDGSMFDHTSDATAHTYQSWAERDVKPTMESAVLRRYLRMWNVDLFDNLGANAVEAFDAGTHRLLHTFPKEDMGSDFTSAEQVNAYVYETLRKIVEKERNATAEEVRARQAEQDAYRKTLEARLRAMREKMFADLYSGGYERRYEQPAPQPTSQPSGHGTEERRAAIAKARKVKRMMDASDNAGIKANAQASLNKILAKHGLALTDL